MRILELINGLGGGGAEQQLLRLCLELRDQGHTVGVACLNQSRGRTAIQLRDAGFSILDLRGRNPFDPRPVLRLRRRLLQTGLELVHSHLARADLVGGLACRGLSVAHVSTRHSDFEPWADRPLWWRTYGRALTRIDRFISVSPAVATCLANWGVPGERVSIIPGVAGEPGLESLPLPCGPLQRIGFLGRLDKVKGIDLFLQCAARLAARNPQLSFLVAGEGPEGPSSRRRARQAGLPVTFLGWVSDLPAFFRQIDLLMVPSRREGLGMSAAEALCAGRAVVGTAVGGLAELLGQAAVPPDVSSLVRAVEGTLHHGTPSRRPLDDPRVWGTRHLEVFSDALQRRRASSSINEV